MRLLFAKSRWEIEHLSPSVFLQRAARDGFERVEINLQGVDDADAFGREARAAGLECIVQLIPGGDNPDALKRSLEAMVERALVVEPCFFNLHAGRDFFADEVNAALVRHARETVARHGLELHVETHRGRACGSIPATLAQLALNPKLTLTADFSHFTCVHESDLTNQAEGLAACIAATRHAHARVGFDHGPQVPNPFAPHVAGWLELFTDFWRRILEARAAAGAEEFTLTPEAGPPGYMWTDPATGEPIRDPWRVNVAMRDHLARVFAAYR